MQKKQAVVIDVGSSKITAVIAERGINNTFIIKGRCTVAYEGFADGVFLDHGELDYALKKTVEDISKYSGQDVDTVYVGVPGEFTKVTVKESQISFPKKKKIQLEDLDTLFEAAFVMPSSKYTLISRSAVSYELDDFRRLHNPVGSTSEILKGKLSFVLCSNYFIESVVPAIKETGVKKVCCIPTQYAEGMYLFDQEARERSVLFADIGYISTTITLMQGDGVVYQKSFSYGGGYITASISEKLGIEFEVAEKLKRKVNLCSISYKDSFSVLDAEDGNYYPEEDIKRTVLDSLDALCEIIYEILEEASPLIPDYLPLKVTGGGITCLRGAKEHMSERLCIPVEISAPIVPLMDKPTESSVLSLLDMALEK